MRKVSIIIPLYNSELYISECIESILEQTYPNIEIIIVNDGSTDNSLLNAKKFERENIRIINQNNKGASSARNTGLFHATGDYIQFLDSDDILDKNKIKNQMDIYKKMNYPNDIILFGPWCILGKSLNEMSDNQKRIWHSYLVPTDILIDIHLIGCCMPHNAYLVPKELLAQSGGWNESLTMNDDGEFFARVIDASKKLVFSSDSLSFYRPTPNSVSKKISDKAVYSQIRSLILTAEIMKRSSNISSKDAIYKMIKSFLYKFYPYYREQRKIGENYLRDNYQNRPLTYPTLNWKERINLIMNNILR